MKHRTCHQDKLKEQVAGFQDVKVERFDAMDVLDH
jgi:hypothetical protein